MSRLLSISILILPLLSACTTLPGQPPQDDDAASSSQIDTITQYTLSDETKQTSLNDYVDESIRLLQYGQVDAARLELAAALQLDPDHPIANSLNRQLDADPVATLGKTHFTYTVKRNDTLSKLAKRYLNDPYKFFILARYNGITEPDRLHTGQVINIPGRRPKPVNTATKRPATAPPKPSPTVKPPQPPALETARDHFAHQRYPETIAALNNVIDQSGTPSAEVQALFSQAHLDYAKTLKSSGDIIASRDLLQNGLARLPHHPALQTTLEDTENKITADTFYHDGLQQLQARQLESAYRYFTDALELNPEHKDAALQAETTKSSLIIQHDKIAMAAYRRQDLATAITAWQKVLELDPDNERAKLYYARSLDLQQRIEAFEQ